jgi:uncharacterized phage protein gp47/JayE
VVENLELTVVAQKVAAEVDSVEVEVTIEEAVEAVVATLAEEEGLTLEVSRLELEDSPVVVDTQKISNSKHKLNCIS